MVRTSFPGFAIAATVLVGFSTAFFTSAATAEKKAGGLQLLSTAFGPGQAIPVEYTCDGSNHSPPLGWKGAPPNTKGWALICEDPDAPKGTFTHWLIYSIPAKADQLSQGLPQREVLSTTAKQGANDFKHVGYGGPCPPPGKPHRYVFKLYALDTTLASLKPGASKKQLLKAMNKHILAQTALTGTYQRKAQH